MTFYYIHTALISHLSAETCRCKLFKMTAN